MSGDDWLQSFGRLVVDFSCSFTCSFSVCPLSTISFLPITFMASDGSVRETSPSPARTDEEEDASLANELALISDRMVREVFPAVLPSEQNALETDVATQLITSARKIDATEIQSYMDEQ